MEIIKSQPSHINQIMNIITDAQQYLAELGIDQWQDGYPDKSIIQQDILRKESYVVINHKTIIGTTVFSLAGDPNYECIEGKWLTPQSNRFGVIHRIAVSNEYRNKGFAEFVFNHFENILKEKHIPSMRVDTHRDNKGMQHLLKKRGYQYCGIIYLANGAERFAFEKVL